MNGLIVVMVVWIFLLIFMAWTGRKPPNPPLVAA